MEKFDNSLNQLKTEKMETITISPDLQEKIDYVLGKGQGYIMYSSVKARLDKQPAKIQTEILASEEFNKYCLDYVAGKTQKESINFLTSSKRLTQLEQSSKEFVVNSEEFKKLVLNFVLAKGQGKKISLYEAQKRIEFIPQELRPVTLANPEVMAAYPGIS